MMFNALVRAIQGTVKLMRTPTEKKAFVVGSALSTSTQRERAKHVSDLQLEVLIGNQGSPTEAR